MTIPLYESVGYLEQGQSVGCGACQTTMTGPRRYLALAWDTADGIIGQAFCSGRCVNDAISKKVKT